jgi:hypothetical protein
MHCVARHDHESGGRAGADNEAKLREMVGLDPAPKPALAGPEPEPEPAAPDPAAFDAMMAAAEVSLGRFSAA